MTIDTNELRKLEAAVGKDQWELRPLDDGALICSPPRPPRNLIGEYGVTYRRIAVIETSAYMALGECEDTGRLIAALRNSVVELCDTIDRLRAERDDAYSTINGLRQELAEETAAAKQFEMEANAAATDIVALKARIAELEGKLQRISEPIQIGD